MEISIKARLLRGMIVFNLIVFVSCASNRELSKSETSQELSKAIDSSSWVFRVIQVKPQQGSNRPPNGIYDVSFQPGKLVVYLPYIGRAFSGADVLQGKSALDFTSTNFDIQKEEVKDNKWTIVIQPKDQPQVQTMNFILFGNGSGSLNITMTNRSPISYDGTVSKAK